MALVVQVAVGLLLWLSAGVTQASQPKAAPAAPATPATASQPNEEHEGLFYYDAGGRRDPFMALVRNGVLVQVLPSGLNSGTPTLSGILWDPGGQSIAIINDGEYRVGEMVGDYEMKEIRQDAVVLVRGGETTVLIFEASPPKPSGAMKPSKPKGR